MSLPCVLLLHGSQQTSEIFRTKLGNFIGKLKKLVQIEILDGSEEILIRSGDEVPTRTWFLRDNHGRIIESSLEKALLLIESRMNAVPVVGLIGFSQGGSLAAFVASNPERFPRLRFIIVAGAPDIPIITSMPAHVKSLHIIGKEDKAVSSSSSLQLSRHFTAPIIIEHEQGHIFPTRAEFQKRYIAFIESQIQGTGNNETSINLSPSSIIEKFISPIHVCASEEVAAQQCEEVEVLQSIYPSEIEIVSPPPTSAGNPCASFIMRVPTDTFCDSDADVEWHQTVCKSLRVEFKCTPEYPAEMLPEVRILRGDIALHLFTFKMEAELSTHLKFVMAENAGSPLGFLCMQAVIDWVAETALKLKIPAPAEVDDEDDAIEAVVCDDTDDAVEWIQLATEESYAVNAQMKAAGQDDNQSFHEPPPPSARGLWHYTVGLVGKPSAGKSTFYNAVTKAALDREGRLMAQVAPHPFTTIEPNVAPGWYASSDDTDIEGRRATLYGRDSRGRRLLPIIVKDVAGLVPGAYKGRGKGNRFLADLCDADVLVHVCDVTGKSDKDGNIIEGAGAEDKRSSPMEDAKWIREELHRWIHGNVHAKWASVRRKEKSGTRIAALFSGYQGPKSCIERAARRAQLDMDSAMTWTPFDIHRVVAHYLTIRFPICLALNKIDMLPNDGDVETVRQCQVIAESQGERAIPVSARAESWILLKEAASHQGSLISKQLPAEGSKAWVDNEQCLQDVTSKFGGTGVLECISAAVSLRPPVLCFPVSDVDTEAPVGWSSSVGKVFPAARDCIQFKPGSTVEDVYESLKRGALDHVLLTGDFVRAEGKGCDVVSKKKQLGRDIMLDSSNCIIRIQTNRKIVWQSGFK